ncbi:hypothetical protein KBZ33_21135 [Cyanobium sp. Cruz-8D1]|uniref:hypothetical protein n=1 Tax=Cyanobium sp. Cruz-8D1 TaxID=2823711 RepID=UPI0020CDAFBA|nr:hypothetical protein [Cyanobium sp. Cruz-8D1]MCP9868742.1 hypothetical protein [Cyanobium sp. Cruz-8D1]
MSSTLPNAGPPPDTGLGVIDIDGDLLREVLRHPVGACGWILQHRDGQLQAELTEALAKVLLACADNERPGEITLKIRVANNPDYPGQMILSDQILTKLPPKATAAPYLFDRDALRLAGELPGQLSIPLAS